MTRVCAQFASWEYITSLTPPNHVGKWLIVQKLLSMKTQNPVSL
jgi:hypothetical protein